MSLTEIYFLSRTNKTLIRGATLIHGMTRALSRIPTYPRQMTSACNVAEYFVKSHLTAPSAVHLTTCFSPDSQHHRLSVKALLPLSPLQRFSVLTLFPNVSHLHCAVNRANLIFPIHDLVVFSRSDLVYNRIDHKEDHAHDCDRHVKGKGIHDQYHP